MLANVCDLDLDQRTGAAYMPWFAAPAIRRECDPSSMASLNLIQSKDWVLEAAEKLEGLSTLPRNWDSYGGSPLKPVAKDFTFRVLQWLDQEDLPTPAVVLGSGGTVQFEWRRQGKELEVDFGEGDGLEYVTIESNGKMHEGHEQSDFRAKLRELAAWFLRG